MKTKNISNFEHMLECQNVKQIVISAKELKHRSITAETTAINNKKSTFSTKNKT